VNHERSCSSTVANRHKQKPTISESNSVHRQIAAAVARRGAQRCDRAILNSARQSTRMSMMPMSFTRMCTCCRLRRHLTQCDSCNRLSPTREGCGLSIDSSECLIRSQRPNCFADIQHDIVGPLSFARSSRRWKLHERIVQMRLGLVGLNAHSDHVYHVGCECCWLGGYRMDDRQHLSRQH
jgi:hypothetical protein